MVGFSLGRAIASRVLLCTVLKKTGLGWRGQILSCIGPGYSSAVMGRRVLSLKGQGLSRMSRERKIWSEKSWDCQDGLVVVVFGLKLVRTFWTWQSPDSEGSGWSA